MKKSNGSLVSKLLLAFFLTLVQLVALAQDTTISTHSETITKSSTTTTDWYMQPWVWVAGGAVFIIILVAMLRGAPTAIKKYHAALP